MKFAFSIFVSLVISISISASADGKAQKARFEPWLKILEASINSSSNPNKVAEELLKGENRIAAFNLQALGKVYLNQDAQFSEQIRVNFKALEDAIGEYDKWNKIAEKSAKEKDKKRVEKAKEKFVNMLKKEKWINAGSEGKLEEIRNAIKKYKWLSYADDKQQIIQDLVTQLENLDQTSFDLSRLEKTDSDGNGLHELRREIRWLMIEMRVLNGLIQFKEDPSICSVPEFAEFFKTPLASSKYSTLPADVLEKDPCRIEQCLFLGLSKSVNTLGEIKDAAEQDSEARKEDRVPKDLLKTAEIAYDELKNTQVFSKLGKNLRQCIQ
ncbi:MAG: hypothetical protein ACXWC9_06205 [Pseudobdellovibrionaceae bacterium]